jgi:hypothetical protein
MNRVDVGNTEGLVRLVKNAKSVQAETGLFPEVEIRFGRVDTRGGRFVPGMSLHDHSRIEKLLDAYPDWSSVQEWTTTHAFFHGSNIPGDTRELRTEHTILSEVSTDVLTAHKECIGKATYRVRDDEKNNTDFRVAVSTERTIDSKARPLSVQPHYTCIKERKEYLYTPWGADAGAPVWCLFLTRRWHASTFVDACAAKAVQRPECDIEIEIVNPAYLKDKSAEEIVFKLLWKIYSICVAIRGSNANTDMLHAELSSTTLT